jgi:hypothetical protein
LLTRRSPSDIIFSLKENLFSLAKKATRLNQEGTQDMPTAGGNSRPSLTGAQKRIESLCETLLMKVDFEDDLATGAQANVVVVLTPDNANLRDVDNQSTYPLDFLKTHLHTSALPAAIMPRGSAVLRYGEDRLLAWVGNLRYPASATKNGAASQLALAILQAVKAFNSHCPALHMMGIGINMPEVAIRVISIEDRYFYTTIDRV